MARANGGAGLTRGRQLSLISQGKGTTLNHLVGVAEQFLPQGQVLDIRPYGNGNVHDTFLVTVSAPDEPRFILQRLNLPGLP